VDLVLASCLNEVYRSRRSAWLLSWLAACAADAGAEGGNWWRRGVYPWGSDAALSSRRCIVDRMPALGGGAGALPCSGMHCLSREQYGHFPLLYRLCSFFLRAHEDSEHSLCLALPFVVQIVNADKVEEAARETDGFFIKSGIVTIIKDALIPAGTII